MTDDRGGAASAGIAYSVGRPMRFLSFFRKFVLPLVGVLLIGWAVSDYDEWAQPPLSYLLLLLVIGLGAILIRVSRRD